MPGARNDAGKLPQVNPLTNEITLLCIRCRTHQVTISSFTWATMVEGRGYPCPANTCKECRTYTPEVRVRWRQEEQQSWHLPE